MPSAYSIIKNNVSIPLLAHIPHSSTYIPPDLRSSFLLNDHQLEKELLLLTDWYVDELFTEVHKSGGISVIYNTSRLVVDPERFENDEEEEMFSRGMGVIYTKTSHLSNLRKTPSEKEREKLLDHFYRPYHRVVEEEVQGILDKFGFCIILDCHSFPSSPLPYELDQDPDRPDICIGVDNFHTPDALTKIIQDFYAKKQLKAFLNKPYAGTYVPSKFYKTNSNITSIMVEINRRRYMNEETGLKSQSFSMVENEIDEMINLIAENINVITSQ
jgi:N-formylglutamate amidohydrolase